MIEVRELTKRYGERAVVQDVSFVVKSAELLVVVGQSGSGKSTLLRMINRLVEPSAGRVLIDGQDTTALPAHLLRRGIGYVFQKIGLFPHMTIAENIAITLRLLNWDEQRCQERVRLLLELVELSPEFAARFPHQLSGGEQQRVGVARALAAEPSVMLLDEPFGALDPLTRDRLQQSFLAIRERLGLTAILVTHDMVEALTLGDRIAVLQRGRLLQIGTAHELLTAPADAYVAELFETPKRTARTFELALKEAHE